MARSVTSIDLSRNPIYNSGDEGHDWIGKMTNLKKLCYSQTYFEYVGVPSQISALTNLMEYDCSYSLYTGPLVGAIFTPLVNLEFLDLSSNLFFGTIPTDFGGLRSLGRPMQYMQIIWLSFFM
jgi:Leucine-rich repeat (LRR) protein